MRRMSSDNHGPMSDGLAERLRHVRWIGGGSGGGKSTVTRLLAARYGVRVYDTDAMMAEHARRTTVVESPFLAAFAAMSMDERWVHRSPETMLETFHWFRGEGFGLIVADLLALPADVPVIAEGFRLLPELVAPLLAVPAHAVWLLPTAEFRRLALESRGETWKIAGRTGNPPVALRNLLERDRMFTDRLHTEVGRLRLPAIRVDGGDDADDLAGRIGRAFGLADSTEMVGTA